MFVFGCIVGFMLGFGCMAWICRRRQQILDWVERKEAELKEKE